MQDFQRLLHRLADSGLDHIIVISLEDLIAAKEAMGREKDLLAAKELRAIAAKRKASGPEAKT